MNRSKPLAPDEAVRAMLSGEVLTSSGFDCRWDGDRFVYYDPRSFRSIGASPILYEFRGLSYKEGI